jgi:hypothetical protein
MKLLTACLAAALLSCPAVASAQATAAKPTEKDSLRDRAIKRCKENRGTDCDSDRGLREWLREERPLTDEEQVSAAAARHLREKCERTKGKASGC